MEKWRVMTVDDSAAILTIIAAYLEDSEFEVIAAERDGVMAELFTQNVYSCLNASIGSSAAALAAG